MVYVCIERESRPLQQVNMCLVNSKMDVIRHATNHFVCHRFKTIVVWFAIVYIDSLQALSKHNPTLYNLKQK